MGKQLKVKKVELPRIDVRKLRDPSELTYKLLALGLPGFAYGTVIIMALVVMPNVSFVSTVGKDLLYWLILAAVGVLIQVGQQKRRLVKAYPRSKVSGSNHPELRSQVYQFCRLLEIKKQPEVYIVDSPDVRASVRGLGSPYLVISSRVLQVLSPREFEGLLATLIGHIKAGTVFWRTLVVTLRDASTFWRIICLPLMAVTSILSPYLEISNHVADRVALLLLRGDYRLLILTVVKQLSYTSASISDAQRAQLQSFLSRSTMEARAEDVEYQMILGRMMDHIPGLKDRVSHLTQADSDVTFDAELEKMEIRMDKLLTAPQRAGG